MILVDTSVWIDHFRKADLLLEELLRSRRVRLHHFVLGEIAMGSMAFRAERMRDLKRIPKTAMARDGEVLELIERRKLFASGVGYVDAHLLASVQITPDLLLWTRDRRLREAAEELSLAWPGAA